MALLAISLVFAAGVFADSSTIDFESGYSAGNINGQQGWSKTGAYDVEVENVADYANASGFGFGTTALRISNAFADGAFGGQAFAPALTQPAGEAGLANFEVSFDIGSATGTQQADLFNSFSPDNGQGGRMSYLGFDDSQVDGIHVIFFDATNPGPLGAATSFNDADVATIDRASSHTARLAMYFLPGPANDVVRVYIDDVLVHTGTSWEDYYRYDTEQTPGNANAIPAVDTMLFRAGGDSVPANNGNGYLIDNVAMTSAAVTQCTSVCYVDDDGTDAAGGTTPATAKQHIQAAIDQVSSNGQVRVLPGNYSETASNRTVTHGASPSGPYQFGLFFDSAKTGVTVMGVTAGDVAITDPSSTQATVTTNATNTFGFSGIFVDANNTTIQGLQIGPNAAGDNKTIEVVADNFSLKYSKTSIPGGGGSVYINDWSATGNDVLAYHVLNNVFTDGTSVDISSGAGSTGPLSGREIKNNTFDLQYSTFAFDFPAVSFNGSGTTVPWFVNSVGGAQITGNTFSDGNQYIRSRGTVATGEFDWGGWFSGNTFETAVMTGPDPASDSLTGYTYACGSYSCPNTKRIGAKIQGEVDHSAASDIVLVKEGDYTENVVASVSGLTFKGPQYGVAFGGRTFDGPSEATLEGQFGLQAANIKVDGFSIQHHVSIDDSAMGVYVKTAGSGATVSNNIFKNLISTGTGSQSRGLAIYLENGPDNVDISDNLIDGVHGKVSSQGILVGDSGATNSSTNVDVTDNTIKNVTSDTKGAYGIQSNNAVGGEMDIDGNTIRDLTASAVGGWIHAIGLENDTPNTTVTHNVISNFVSPSTNQVAVWLEGPNGVYQNVLVNRNSLNVGSAQGIYVDPATPANGNVDGTCNWWGSTTGPGAIATGSGSGVSAKVGYTPWLLSDTLGGACTGIPQEIDVTPAAGHNFGNQNVNDGASAAFTYTVTNVGNINLVLGTVTITGTNSSHFIIDADDCSGQTLAPAADCTVDVTFDPSSAGAKTATLNIPSNDADEANVTRALSGTGTTGPTTGNITIILNAVPNSSQDFGFTGDLGSFTLDDDSNGAHSNSRSVTGLPPGTYSVTQGAVSGWSLTGLSCNTGESTNTSTRTATITLTAGENVTCTFTDSYRRPDALISNKVNKKYRGNGIYSSTVLSTQTVTRPVARNTTRKQFLRFQNDGPAVDSFTVDANFSGSASYTVQFFSGATNITAAVLAGTYHVNSLGAGLQVTIEMRITAASNTAASATANVDVFVSSDSQPSQMDVVRGHIKRA